MFGNTINPALRGCCTYRSRDKILTRGATKSETLIESIGKLLKKTRMLETSRWIANMPRDFFDPTPDEQRVRLIDAETRRKAEKLIESCEHCNPLGAEIPFDNIFDRVTASDPKVTDYI